MAAVENFLPAARSFLDEVEASVQTLVENLGSGERALQENKAQIGTALRQLSQDLEIIGGSDGNAS